LRFCVFKRVAKSTGDYWIAIFIGYNPLIEFPELPPHLICLGCSKIGLTFLPPLPQGLIYLFCDDNPLDTLPDLPSTLRLLTFQLPDTKESCTWDELTPEQVQQLNHDIQRKKRCMERCKSYKEEIMMKAWHPTRVEKLLEMGYDMEDM